ncbi:hypothetical protein SELMODRAFT_90103 [Selaginella moellendorffii]|uniref:Uncharacterized protein n=1 Tax=Selaginella moellendorffii TaxID=88036 RepID=D8RCG1_SELML|nr:hypothetical protein SELMODRAFT_90103 [Selaginella moellendorffii]
MLDLTGCKSLTLLPDFPSHCGIRRLSLRWCSRIQELPDSIGNLERLETFDLAGTSVSSLPGAFGNIKKLENLDISFCMSLSSLPTSFAGLSHLKSLHMFRCGIVKLNQGFGELRSLVNLDMAECSQFTELSPDFGKLVSLEELILKNCKEFSMLPQGFENLKNLLKLDLEGCALVQLPDAFGGLGSLTRLNSAYSRIQAVPLSVSYLDKTEQLRLDHCFLLTKVSGLPGALKSIPGQLRVLDVGECFQLEVLRDLGELHHLEKLILCNCINLKEIHGVDRLSSLTSLNLSGCCKLSNSNVPGLSECKSLQRLYLSGSKVHISPNDLEVCRFFSWRIDSP